MKQYVTFQRNEAKIIQDGYRCAGCWNRLVCGHDKGGDFMDCGTDDCNLPGLVSERWVERQLQEGEARAKEAREVLSQSFEWMKVITENHSIKENLKALGF